jgi:hypothetical protein
MARFALSAFNRAHCTCKTPASPRLARSTGLPAVKYVAAISYRHGASAAKAHGQDGLATTSRTLPGIKNDDVCASRGPKLIKAS